LHKRTRKDIWENLYEPYLIESEEDIVWNTSTIAQWIQEQWNVTAFNTLQISTKEVQQLTHQQITGVMIYIRLQQPIPELKQYEKVPWNAISDKPFPKLIHQLLQQLNLLNK
jgi:A/G-specific adenine glycosylase